MNRKIAALALIALLLIIPESCTILKRPLDKRTQFSEQLATIKNCVSREDWASSIASQNAAEKTWKSIKPLLQIDIDHDYVNEIENSFTELKAYIQARDKSKALAEIMLIQDLWDKIGEM
jgi:hypothetical protein